MSLAPAPYILAAPINHLRSAPARVLLEAVSRLRNLLATAVTVCASFLLTTTPSHVYAASIGFRDDGYRVNLILVGEIKEGDSDQLQQTILEVYAHGRDVGFVELYSPGGNAIEGILLARLIRTFHLKTSAKGGVGQSCTSDHPLAQEIAQNCLCASACGLAWLGGIERFGSPGFHRAYMPRTDMKLSDVRIGLGEFNAEVNRFLEEIQAPGWLRDIISSTGRSEMHYLDNAEWLELSSDPIYEDYSEGICGPNLKNRDPCRAELAAQVGREAYATFLTGTPSQQ